MKIYILISTLFDYKRNYVTLLLIIDTYNVCVFSFLLLLFFFNNQYNYSLSSITNGDRVSKNWFVLPR